MKRRTALATSLLYLCIPRHNKTIHFEVIRRFTATLNNIFVVIDPPRFMPAMLIKGIHSI
ncbi:MAG TPA: hypothetical protein VNT20_14320 [Flavisolibacter sp.]|jgi:hypothetical protein|nr:hypothetical protein [Flavisolibacter sp.]